MIILQSWWEKRCLALIVCAGSFKPGYLTYCAERHRVQVVQQPQIHCDGCRSSCHNRMLAAERREATLRVQQRAGPPQATTSGWFSELLLGVPLSCHHSQSAADALCCLSPALRARHRRRGLEIQPDLHSFSFLFHSLAYSMVCCHITPFCGI